MLRYISKLLKITDQPLAVSLLVEAITELCQAEVLCVYTLTVVTTAHSCYQVVDVALLWGLLSSQLPPSGVRYCPSHY